MSTSLVVKLSSGEEVSVRADDRSVGTDRRGRAGGRWLVIGRPRLPDLLIGIRAGTTLEELTSTLSRLLGASSASEVIGGLGLGEDLTPLIPTRAFEPEAATPDAKTA